jgi:hypothetical protein
MDNHDAVTRPTPPAMPGSWPRRITRAVRIGGVVVGGGKPVVVQSMTNTDTADVASSVRRWPSCGVPVRKWCDDRQHAGRRCRRPRIATSWR